VKKPALFCICSLAAALAAHAQVSVSEDVTALYAFGIADSDQAIDSGEPGAYATLKNGYYVNAGLGFKINVAYLYDISVKLYARGRVGSPYVPAQLAPASLQSLGLTLDSAYGRIDVLNGLKIPSPVGLYLTLGKFGAAASNFQRASPFGLESALNMIKLGTDLNVGIEAVKTFSSLEQMFETTYSSLCLQLVASGTFDEGVERLYDSDGSMSNHGKAVVGEYAPQLLASLRLSNFALPFGILSAEGVYGLNAGDIYSGNSFGASASLSLSVVPELLSLPIGLGAAYYEKNIDTLGASVGTDMATKSTDFRRAIRAGASLGVRYAEQYVACADLNLAASYADIGHIYRDPITLVGLSIDGKFTYLDRYFIGGGFILGTIADVTWKTRDGVAALFDDYSHTFTPAQNLGYEGYLGIAVGSKCSVVLGANNNKGLAMNYGLESLKEGEVKVLQKAANASTDKLYETFSVYLKTTVKM
jgi:hypothetical protein